MKFHVMKFRFMKFHVMKSHLRSFPYEVSPYEVAHVASSLAPCLRQLRLIDLHAALSVIQLDSCASRVGWSLSERRSG